VKAFMARHFSSLRPADEDAEQLLQHLKHGEVVQVEIRRPRNPRMHRMFWALATLVWQQLDHENYPTVEGLVTELKITTGHYTRRDIKVNDKRYPVLTPQSISFAAMDQTEFEKFFERCCDHIAADVLPGVSVPELREEIEIMIGIRA